MYFIKKKKKFLVLILKILLSSNKNNLNLSNYFNTREFINNNKYNNI